MNLLRSVPLVFFASVFLFGCSENSKPRLVKRAKNQNTKIVAPASSIPTYSTPKDKTSTAPKLQSELETLYKLHLLALENNLPGKEYTYNLTGNDDCNKTRIAYLGLVTTEMGKRYKFVNSFYVTGPSCRGISRLVVYSEKNRYLGNYYLQSLPVSLTANQLIYPKWTISLRNGLPESINDGSGESFFQLEE